MKHSPTDILVHIGVTEVPWNAHESRCDFQKLGGQSLRRKEDLGEFDLRFTQAQCWGPTVKKTWRLPQKEKAVKLHTTLAGFFKPTLSILVVYLKQSKWAEVETVISTFWRDWDIHCFYTNLLAKTLGSLPRLLLLLLFWNYGLCRARLQWLHQTLLLMQRCYTSRNGEWHTLE